MFIPRMVALPAQGKFPLHKLVQHYQLAEINDAFKASESGAVVKPVVLH